MHPDLFKGTNGYVRPQEVMSTKFSLKFRRSDQKVYKERSVNKSFEDRHIEMFKIVPPCVGSILNLECSMRIDSIEYNDGEIVFWVSELEM